MRKTRIALLLVLLCSLASVTIVAAAMYSSNNGIPWDARWGGGGQTSSDNYAINGTIGQAAIGWIGSENYGVGAGYWYGVISDYKVYLPLALHDGT